MDELIEFNLQFAPNQLEVSEVIRDILRDHKNWHEQQQQQHDSHYSDDLNKKKATDILSPNHILMHLLIHSDDQRVKGAIAAHFYNSYRATLRGDTGEVRHSALETIYEKIMLEDTTNNKTSPIHR
jgi:hypothetical protein